MTWGYKVSVELVCVSTPEHVGARTMHSPKKAPGASMSGITQNLARPDWLKRHGKRTHVSKYAKKYAGEAKYGSSSWKVQCYTLERILAEWGVDLAAQHTMFKVDLEGYECKLIPSFYYWLKDQPRLPTMCISFHPQIEDCTSDEWEGVLKTVQLYKHVYALGDTMKMVLNPTTRLEEFEAMKSALRWQSDSTFVVSQERRH